MVHKGQHRNLMIEQRKLQWGREDSELLARLVASVVYLIKNQVMNSIRWLVIIEDRKRFDNYKRLEVCHRFLRFTTGVWCLPEEEFEVYLKNVGFDRRVWSLPLPWFDMHHRRSKVITGDWRVAHQFKFEIYNISLILGVLNF